jgi:REP element-mobilizing transposase RayT
VCYLLHPTHLDAMISTMEDEETLFYNPKAAKKVYRRHLPHWNQAGRIYFVTFRLADSIPAARAAELRRQRQVWRKAHTMPYSPAEQYEYRTLFSRRIERWLDECAGSCLLAELRCAQIVIDALTAFEQHRYDLDQWVVMPNHVHVLVRPYEAYSLKAILQIWKSFTAHAINKHLSRRGQLWQRESFDHIVRSADHLERLRRYIRANPEKAGRYTAQCRVAPS